MNRTPRPTRAAVGLVLLAVVAALLAVGAPAQSTPTTSGSGPGSGSGPARLTLDELDARVVPGARQYLFGGLAGPGPNRRPIRLELDRGDGWAVHQRGHTIGVTGGFDFSVDTPRRGGALSWRVVAPRVRVSGGVARRLVSPVRRQRVVVQQVTWRLPSRAEIGTRAAALVQVRPLVGYQSLTLQQRVNGRWQYVAQDRVRRAGTSLDFTVITRGPSRFRVLGPTGPLRVRTLTGTPTDVVLATRRVSTTSNGSQFDGSSSDASSSDSGRYVAFRTYASNAVPGGSTGRRAVYDLYLKDVRTGTLTRITDGVRGRANGDSRSPEVSGDGRYVAFVSAARNLVPGDTNRSADVFVWERATGRTTRVGLAASEPTISADGRFVAYASGGDVVLHDRVAGTATTVSEGGNAASGAPSISADGRYVAYETLASDLTPDGVAGVLVWDRTTGGTELVSTTSAGVPATGGRSRHPQLDADGSVVAFESRSDDLGAAGTTQVYVKDLATGTTTLVSQVAGVPGNRISSLARLSADGSRVLFSSDADLVADDEDRDYCEHEIACYYDEYRTDAYVADVVAGVAGEVTMVSRTAGGESSDFYAGGRDLTADGGQAVFVSRDVLVPGQGSRGQIEEIYLDVFVRDLD